jgi:hypothetical protein
MDSSLVRVIGSAILPSSMRQGLSAALYNVLPLSACLSLSQEEVLSRFRVDQGAPDRRSLLRMAAAGLSMGAPAASALTRNAPGGPSGRFDPVPTQQLGAITGNDTLVMEGWARWLGRPQDHDLLYFNQDSWPKLEASVDYIVDVGRKVLARRRRVQWSVPVAGWGAYDSLDSGRHDALYQRIAGSILGAYSEDRSRICIRPPWEFNIAGQSQASRSLVGVWDGRPYIAGYRRIAGIFRKVSPRFYFDWCPAVGMGELDPEACYPGDDLVDVISVDVYYRKQYDDQGRADNGAGLFGYRKTQPRGLDWLDRFAAAHHKLIGVSEWGVDSDRATVFTARFADWIKALGPRLSHQNYWDRTDGGVNSRLSDGGLPAIGAIYRQAFARA